MTFTFHITWWWFWPFVIGLGCGFIACLGVLYWAARGIKIGPNW